MTKKAAKSTSTACSTQSNRRSPYAGKRGVTRIHVNMHNIRANKKNGSNLPVITVKKGKQNVYGHTVEINGPSAVVYSPDNPLGCGARVWVETVSGVTVQDHTPEDPKTIELETTMSDTSNADLEQSLVDQGIMTASIPPSEQEAHWTEFATTKLKGRKIETVRYLSSEEASVMYWSSRPLVIQLDDGTLIFPSSDDEGNDGGALLGQDTNNEQLTFPVLR